uniref:RdRp catalytic domain-containing protein n=1 Tax=Trichuris muris TaxID=70415 RepID=A0A5S6QG35_TRIMR
MISEVFGLYRMWGHPVVDEVAGSLKVQEVDKRPIELDLRTLELLYACLIKEFCINYIRLEGMWPKLTFSNAETNRIVQLCSRRQLNWIEQEGSTGLNDWAQVFPVKNFEFDYCLDHTQILDDKAIWTYKEHWDQVYDSKRLGYVPEKSSESRRVMLEVLSHEDIDIKGMMDKIMSR